MNWDDKDEVIEGFNSYRIWSHEKISTRLKDDADVARMMFERSGDVIGTFEEFSPRLRDDEDFVRYVVKKCPGCFEHCSDRLKDNEDIARCAIGASGHIPTSDPTEIFESCSARLRDDADLAKYAIDVYPRNFQYCSDRLKDDISFATMAVEEAAGNFCHCSDRLKDDTALATMAVEKAPRNFEHCSERLQSDPKFQAYAELRKAEIVGRSPDLSPFTKYIRDAHLAATACHDKNSKELRETFAIYAVQFEATALAQQQGQQQQPLPRQVTPDDVLPDVDAFDFSPAR